MRKKYSMTDKLNILASFKIAVESLESSVKHTKDVEKDFQTINKKIDELNQKFHEEKGISFFITLNKKIWHESYF